MNLNLKQVLAIILVILGVLTVSTAQLTDLFGAGNAKAIISLASIMNSALAGILGVITSQGSTVNDVQNMAGVDQIIVNKKANYTLATMAVDPGNPKIQTKQSDEAIVSATASA